MGCWVCGAGDASCCAVLACAGPGGLLWPSGGLWCVGVVWLGVLPGSSLLVGGGLGWGVCCRVLGRCALVWPVWCPAGGVLVGAAVGGLVVICIVDASIFVLCVARAAPPSLLHVLWGCGLWCCLSWLGLCFVFLGVRWMPWHQGPMKDVVACDKPRGAGWRAVIRGCPNGGTRRESCRVTCI